MVLSFQTLLSPCRILEAIGAGGKVGSGLRDYIQTNSCMHTLTHTQQSQHMHTLTHTVTEIHCYSLRFMHTHTHTHTHSLTHAHSHNTLTGTLRQHTDRHTHCFPVVFPAQMSYLLSATEKHVVAEAAGNGGGDNFLKPFRSSDFTLRGNKLDYMYNLLVLRFNPRE